MKCTILVPTHEQLSTVFVTSSLSWRTCSDANFLKILRLFCVCACMCMYVCLCRVYVHSSVSVKVRVGFLLARFLGMELKLSVLTAGTFSGSAILLAFCL